MMERRRVVVTGVGTVNALGAGGTRALAAALDAGGSAIRPVESFPVEACASRLGAEVASARLQGLIDQDQARRLSRICQLTVAACRLAVTDAGLEGRAAELGIVLGTEFGDFRSSEAFPAGFFQRGPAGLSPLLFPNTVMNAMAGAAAIALGARGPSVTLNQATVAGDLAIARGASLIAQGRASAVLAGGSDELTGPVFRRLAAMRAISPMQGGGTEGCRPYAPDHNGPVLGEGATFVMLEWLEAARARSADIRAEILAADWGNIPAPPHAAHPRRRDPHSPARAALARSGIAPSALGRCYGSGNGDPALDDWEQALLDADGIWTRPRPDRPRSLAPLFGQHGALGALRVGAAALDVSRGEGPVLIHGIARGGCRVAVVVGPLGQR